jgi:hypothetical protein
MPWKILQSSLHFDRLSAGGQYENTNFRSKFLYNRSFLWHWLTNSRFSTAADAAIEPQFAKR